MPSREICDRLVPAGWWRQRIRMPGGRRCSPRSAGIQTCLSATQSPSSTRSLPRTLSQRFQPTRYFKETSGAKGVGKQREKSRTNAPCTRPGPEERSDACNLGGRARRRRIPGLEAWSDIDVRRIRKNGLVARSWTPQWRQAPSGSRSLSPCYRSSRRSRLVPYEHSRVHHFAVVGITCSAPSKNWVRQLQAGDSGDQGDLIVYLENRTVGLDALLPTPKSTRPPRCLAPIARSIPEVIKHFAEKPIHFGGGSSRRSKHPTLVATASRLRFHYSPEPCLRRGRTTQCDQPAPLTPGVKLGTGPGCIRRGRAYPRGVEQSESWRGCDATALSIAATNDLLAEALTRSPLLQKVTAPALMQALDSNDVPTLFGLLSAPAAILNLVDAERFLVATRRLAELGEPSSELIGLLVGSRAGSLRNVTVGSTPSYGGESEAQRWPFPSAETQRRGRSSDPDAHRSSSRRSGKRATASAGRRTASPRRGGRGAASSRNSSGAREGSHFGTDPSRPWSGQVDWP